MLSILYFILFFSLTSFYVLIVGAEGYCCTQSQSVTHTHAHTHKHGRTPLDEGSARFRDLYLTTHNTHKRQSSMHPAGVFPTQNIENIIVSGGDCFALVMNCLLVVLSSELLKSRTALQHIKF